MQTTETAQHMNVAAWIATGIVIGWIANHLLNQGSRDGRLGYLAFGVLGAFAGVQLLAPTPDPGATVDVNAFSMTLLMCSAAGAVVLLFVGNMVRQRFFP